METRKKNKLRVIISIFILSCLLIFTAIANTNDITYTETSINPNTGYPNIELKNATTNQTIAELALTQHTESCGWNNLCLSKLEINHTGGVLLDDLTFYTIVDWNGIEFKFPQDIRWHNLFYETELPEYEENCTLQIINETEIEVCEQVLTGGTYPANVSYTLGEERPSGIYELYLEGEKRPDRMVDWVFTKYGVPLTGHAIWGNISLGDEAEIILNSPANNSKTLVANNLFNYSWNITNGAYAVNTSLILDGIIVNTSKYGNGVYDEIDDSSINSSLWNTSTSFTGALRPSLSEDATDISATATFDVSSSGTASETLRTNSLDSSSTENISFNANIGVSSASYSGGSVSITAFGNVIRTYTTSGSDTSTWSLLKNNTQWDVYDDGVYQETITPTTDYIQFYAYQTAASSSIKSFGYYNLNYLYTGKNFALTKTFNKTLTQNGNWTTRVCDSDGVCYNETPVFLINLDFPNFTIVSPPASISNATFTLNYSVGSLGAVNYTYYNITKGASTEVANTNLSAIGGYYNDTITLSGEGTYVINLWANQSGGISNTTSLTLNYAITPVIGGGGGGSSTTPPAETQEPKETCEIYTEPLREAWDNFQQNFSFESFLDLLKAFFTSAVCDSAASIVPIVA